MLPLLFKGDQVTGMPWDAQGEAQAALRAIVADPRYGPPALSHAQTMTNLLKDMLPDAPRESSVLVAASEAGVAGLLQSNVAQGMDLATASRLAAGSFENRTALTPDACHWAVGILASALGLSTVRAASPQPPKPVYDAPWSAGSEPRTMASDPTSAPPAWVVPPPPLRSEAARADGPRLTAAVVSAVGAVLIIWACALPDLYLPASNGRTSFSVFNGGGAGDLWFAVEPVGVAVIGGLAALIILRANLSARLRLLATGVLFGFGIQTILLFAGYEFYVRSPNHAGPGAAVGILGGLLWLVAALIAAAGRQAAP
jgi:hypothetical protein